MPSLKKSLLTVLITFLLTGISPALIKDNASGKAPKSGTGENYNRAMKSYSKKDYKSAAGFFKKSAGEFPGEAAVNYNLACLYALLLDDCQTIDTGEDSAVPEEEIFTYLEKAISIDPALKNRAQKDRDFLKVKEKARFLTATGQYAPDQAGVKKFLCRVNAWYTGNCSMGAYGCDSVKFFRDGSVEYRPYGPDCESLELPAGECGKIKKNNKGRYRVLKDRIVIIYNDGRKFEFSYPDKKGELYEMNGGPSGKKNSPETYDFRHSTDGRGKLSDVHPEPCSA